jgi:hypothetical protein
MRQQNPKRELSPLALQRLKAKIWLMPWIDRTEILIAAMIDREREVTGTSLAMAAFVGRLAEHCGTADKIRIGEALRTTADILDHELMDAVYEEGS